MFNRNHKGCDTIFNESQQETYLTVKNGTPPVKKVFVDSAQQYPAFNNDIRTAYQTPQTKIASLANSDQKSGIRLFENELNFGSQPQKSQRTNTAKSFQMQSFEDEQILTEKSKSCKCSKSKCLKLYCDCFASGQVCGPKCICQGCSNNLAHQLQRSKVIEKIIEKKPDAFNQKIKQNFQLSKPTHAKGCNCRKSGCQKKYCECFNAGVECSDQCNCDNCKNHKIPFLSYPAKGEPVHPINRPEKPQF